MVIIVKDGTKEERIRDLIQWIESQNLRTHVSTGDYSTIIGVIGDTSKLDEDLISGLDIVEGVKRVSEPFKSANRKFHPQDSIIEVGEEKLKVGHGNFAMIAGPCSVESEEQIISVAKSVKAAGATMLRGGAFKPRTSPYDFQGLKADGIELLLEAKRETGLPIVTEIMNANHLPLFEDVDVIQVGARNMQNFDLLKQLGKTSAELSQYFLEQAKVALVPGDVFGPGGEGYLRMSFAASYESIVEGCERLKAAVEQMRG